MYITIEIQRSAEGQVGTLVYSHSAKEAADASFHQILAAAAQSSLPAHAALLLDENGSPLRYECYTREGT